MAKGKKAGKSRRRRRCKICGKLFTPNPKVAKRQTVCSKRSCQKERKRLSLAEAHLKEKMELRDERARKRLLKPGVGDGRKRKDFLENINWNAFRNAMGPEAKVLFEELVKAVLRMERTSKSKKT